ncbi:MAG TPA: hypothetical protein VFL97_04950 [Nitrococcus sp.]|nr:hypothetical protein [Nitrococcus sp.]
MNKGLVACISLSVLVPVAQAAPDSTSASKPLRLAAPQMDAVTAGTASVWINSAASGVESNGFGHTANIDMSDYAGICCGSNANVQLVFEISGFSSTKGVITSSPEGTTLTFGKTIFERNIQTQ